MKTPFKKHSKLNENRVSLNTERKYRHGRDLRVQMQELGSTEQQLHADQLHLDHKLRRLEKQLKTFDLDARVGRLEAASKMAVKALFNESRQLAGMDKIHQSMLELLESVENLENRVDKNVPELQREISKMEFNMAQMTSSVALVKEEQENQGATSKAIFNGIVAIEEKIGSNRAHITVMQAQLRNQSERGLPNAASSETSNATAVSEPGDDSKNTRCTNPVLRLVHQLGRVQDEYQKIIRQLPRDCSGVSGPSGLYLISPGLEHGPVMTYCLVDAVKDASWTVVQRRVDGSQEFNRKWQEYATGFGSPSGEFWLGNDALHLLTADNCSVLRVDFTDIYGKLWHAEYSEFSVAAAADGYRLHVAGYTGNASDALEYQNRMQFSTVDSDRDISNTHCASNYEGGWWFSHCQHANLNGKYTLGLTWFDAMRNEWIAVAKSEMKVRRRAECKAGRTIT